MPLNQEYATTKDESKRNNKNKPYALITNHKQNFSLIKFETKKKESRSYGDKSFPFCFHFIYAFLFEINTQKKKERDRKKRFC